MNCFNRNKIYYALYSPITWIYLYLKGVKTYGKSFFCGFPYISNVGHISIGSKCRFMSKSTGNPIGLNHRCMFTTHNRWSNITIGNGCGFSGCSLWCFTSISIGNNVRVGANTLIMDGDAHQEDVRAGDNKPIQIKDNVWIGGNVVIMKGVTIGKNTLIGMNSVVTRDIPDNVIAAGNPCKVIRQLTQEQIQTLEML